MRAIEYAVMSVFALFLFAVFGFCAMLLGFLAHDAQQARIGYSMCMGLKP